MAVQIELDSSERLGSLQRYMPEQPITGRVIYTPKHAQEKIDNVSIHFEGHGRIAVDSLDRWGDNLNDLIFHHEKRLLQGPFTVAQQTFTWPFDFVFPGRLLTHGSRALPPSFSQYFDEKIGRYQGFQASIEYELRAVVDHGSMVRSPTSSRVQVAFRPLANGATPKPQIQTCNLEQPNAHSLKQKLNIFGSKQSSAKFQATVFLPQVLAPSMTQPLSLSIQGPTNLEKPKLVLQDVELILHSSTKSIRGAHVTRDDGKFSLRDLNARFPSTDEQVYVSSDFGLNSFHVAPSITPDFSSSTPFIEYTHGFKVQAKVQDEESGDVFKLEGACPVSVLPAQ